MNPPGSIDSSSKASAPIHSSAARGRQLPAGCRPLPGLSPLRATLAPAAGIGSKTSPGKGWRQRDPLRRPSGRAAQLSRTVSSRLLPPLPELRRPHPWPRHPALCSENIAVPVLQPHRDYLCYAQLHPTLRDGRRASRDSARSRSCAALGVRVPAVGTPLLRGTGGAEGRAEELPQAIPARPRYGT